MPSRPVLVDTRVGVRGWEGFAAVVVKRRVAPLVLPGVPCVRSVMGRLQPVVRRITRGLSSIATGAQVGAGVIGIAWVVLAVSNLLVLGAILGNVGMRSNRSRAQECHHRRHEHGYRSQQDDASHRISPPFPQCSWFHLAFIRQNTYTSSLLSAKHSVSAVVDSMCLTTFQ